VTMPPELRKAHQENDKAVIEAYGFDWKKMTESECVARLLKMYQELTSGESRLCILQKRYFSHLPVSSWNEYS